MYFTNRKSTRLAPQNYVGRQFHFLTLCCFERSKPFLHPACCETTLNVLRAECAQRNFAAHAYCLMPDHFHLLCEGLSPTSDFLRLVMSFRIKTSRRFAQDPGGVLWQRGYYDHILRARRQAEPVAWYIWLNPVRKGLVSTPQHYPFAGSFTNWKMPSTWSDPDWCPPWKQPPGDRVVVPRELWGYPSEDDRSPPYAPATVILGRMTLPPTATPSLPKVPAGNALPRKCYPIEADRCRFCAPKEVACPSVE